MSSLSPVLSCIYGRAVAQHRLLSATTQINHERWRNYFDKRNGLSSGVMAERSARLCSSMRKRYLELGVIRTPEKQHYCALILYGGCLHLSRHPPPQNNLDVWGNDGRPTEKENTLSQHKLTVQIEFKKQMSIMRLIYKKKYVLIKINFIYLSFQPNEIKV